MTINLDRMVTHYLYAAEWADCGPDSECYGHEFSEEFKAQARVDCAAFLVTCATLIDEVAEHAPDYSDERFGHDFWLTRNGHGAGYWDREELTSVTLNRANFGPGSLGDALSAHAKRAGAIDLYLGDDGEVYGG